MLCTEGYLHLWVWEQLRKRAMKNILDRLGPDEVSPKELPSLPVVSYSVPTDLTFETRIALPHHRRGGIVCRV